MRLAFCFALVASVGFGIVGCSDDDYRSTVGDGGTTDGGTTESTDASAAADMASHDLAPPADLAPLAADLAL